VRLLSRVVLDRAGYRVLEASGPRQGLQVATDYPGDIDLILSDVMMPDSEGPLLVDRLRPTRPDLRVLYMSGYPDETVDQNDEAPAGFPFLAKPFTPLALAEKVREVLDAPRRG
jgi:two-component system cell cycle sensor histidine kinase/response regulator CckA